MMNEKTLYECSFCGQTSLDRDSCLACERSHISPLYIEESTWYPSNGAAGGYPLFINIHMADSSIVKYSFSKVLPPIKKSEAISNV